MAFHVESLSLELIALLRPLLPRIKRCDRSLADQISRAASSVALNLGESRLSDPGNRRARLHTAAGSAAEVHTALRVVRAWGHVPERDMSAAISTVDQICAILWKMTH